MVARKEILGSEDADWEAVLAAGRVLGARDAQLAARGTLAIPDPQTSPSQDTSGASEAPDLQLFTPYADTPDNRDCNAAAPEMENDEEHEVEAAKARSVPPAPEKVVASVFRYAASYMKSMNPYSRPRNDK